MLSSKLRRRSGYRPVLQALPFDFLQRSDASQQVRSLQSHCEKQALAALLHHESGKGAVEGDDNKAMAPKGKQLPEVSINFRMCRDCHE